MTETTVSPSAFKQFNKLMILLWRLGLGPWINSRPEEIGRIMVLVHTGRKSGLQRRTPVNYARVIGDVYCLAGFGRTSDWYRNVMANPNVEAWLPDGWWAGQAEEITDPEERLIMLRQILANSGFASETFSAINPHQISDEDLRAKTADWPVVHIRLEQPRSGRGGPGDLAWAWPIASAAALVAWLWLRRRRA